MIDFSTVTIDLTHLPDIEAECQAHLEENPACHLHSHWQNAQAGDRVMLKDGRFAALNWLGNGYPATFDRKMGFKDYLHLEEQYAQPATLDCQSALHQFYQIAALCHEDREDLWIVDIGGGYGRLAIPFFLAFGKRCHYVSVDYVPLSMCAAPQVMQQLIPGCDFSVVPAWRIEELPSLEYHIGVSVHSFQEMAQASIAFYLKQLHRLLAPWGIFYSVNQQPDFDQGQGYLPQSAYCYDYFFNLALSASYPFNLGPLEMPEIVMVKP